MTKMKYRAIKACHNVEDTELNVNLLAAAGWKIKCSYRGGDWFMMEKEIEEPDVNDEEVPINFAEYADFETKRESKAKRNKAHPFSRTSRGKHSLKR